jgi:hypothetical protein
MHMDGSKNPISQNEVNLQPASDRPLAVDASPADSASSHTPIAREQHPHFDQITPWQNDRCHTPSTVVYCGSEEDVLKGFLIALNAMGVAVVEAPAEPAKAPVGGVKP